MCVPASIAARMLSGRGVGGREVDDHVNVANGVCELDSQLGVDPRGKLEVIRGLDGLAGGRAHPAGRAGNSNLDHAASASETAPTAFVKHSSSLPMQAALNPFGS